MFRKVVFSLVLLSTVFLDARALASYVDENNLVYVIQFASVSQFGVSGGTITVPFDASFTGIAPQELTRKENWTIEVDGSPVPNEIVRVRVEAIPNPRFIRFDTSGQTNFTGHRVRLIFRGASRNITLDVIETFNLIEILFAHDVPPDEALLDERNWVIRTVDLQTGAETQFAPDDVTVAHPPNLKSIPSLRVNRRLDPSAERITVRLQLPNFSEFTIGEPKKKGARAAFTAAKGKDDADIYFSGTATGARASKPLYAFESKLGYLFSLRRKGALGPRVQVDAASESNIDPDSIKASLSYEKVFVLGPARGLILRSDAIGLEFDKDNRNRNLMTELNMTFVPPAARLSEGTFVAVDFMLGFEGGHNYRHELNEERGLGNLWRWKGGANFYFVALHPPTFKRIDFSTQYKLRLLNDAEPFTEKINDKDVTSLTKKPRHYVASDLDLMFSDAFGITLKYRYGSLPPEFKFVNHTGSVGLTFKLKQANK